MGERVAIAVPAGEVAVVPVPVTIEWLDRVLSGGFLRPAFALARGLGIAAHDLTLVAMFDASSGERPRFVVMQRALVAERVAPMLVPRWVPERLGGRLEAFAGPLLRQLEEAARLRLILAVSVLVHVDGGPECLVGEGFAASSYAGQA